MPVLSPEAQRKKTLMDLLKLPENQVCADCPEKGPRWACAKAGVFICIECSGIHRNLGTHISFVRSVNLDDWKQEHVDQMVKWGNKRAKLFWEAEVPAHYRRPGANASVHEVTKWIRDKYEHRRFAPHDGQLPPENDYSADPEATAKEKLRAAREQLEEHSDMIEALTERAQQERILLDLESARMAK